MRQRLPRSFFTRPTLVVAKDLLGAVLVRKLGPHYRKGIIVETEAYVGPADRASHAYGGKVTPRNRVEYLSGGRVYIYLVYGMYWQLNITTAGRGEPECILIRALDVSGRDPALARGPGKVCQYLRLAGSSYGEDVVTSKRLWIEDRGRRLRPRHVATSPRIGIDYAGPYWARRHWRFFLRGNPAVSKP